METPGSAPAIDEQTHEQPRKQSLRGSMSLLLGLLLSGAFLYLALRNTNPALTWQTLSSVNPAFLIPVRAHLTDQIADQTARRGREDVALARARAGAGDGGCQVTTDQEPRPRIALRFHRR